MKRIGKARGQWGFSLIEMLIVVGVILIISAFVYPQVTKRRDLAKVRSCFRQFSAVKMAQTIHYSDFNAYAASNAELLNHFHTTSNNNISYLNYELFANATRKSSHCLGFQVTATNNQTWYARVNAKIPGSPPNSCVLSLNVTNVGVPPNFVMTNCPNWMTANDIIKN